MTLDRETERELVRRMHKLRRQYDPQWELIRNQLVESLDRLAWSVVHRMARRREDRNELFSEAMFAVIKAVETHNPDSGSRLATYAYTAIRWAIMKLHEDEDRQRGRIRQLGEGDENRLTYRPDPAARIAVLDNQRVARRLLDTLPIRERSIVQRRYGIGEEPWTVGEIAKSWRLTTARVYMLENESICRMRRRAELMEVGSHY